MGNDRDDSSNLWIGVLVWTILPDRFAIHARYTDHRRFLEASDGRRFFFKVWGRKQSTSAGLREVDVLIRFYQF